GRGEVDVACAVCRDGQRSHANGKGESCLGDGVVAIHRGGPGEPDVGAVIVGADDIRVDSASGCGSAGVEVDAIEGCACCRDCGEIASGLSVSEPDVVVRVDIDIGGRGDEAAG